MRAEPVAEVRRGGTGMDRPEVLHAAGTEPLQSPSRSSRLAEPSASRVRITPLYGRCLIGFSNHSNAVVVMQLAPWPPPKVRPLSEERVLYVSDDVHVTARRSAASPAQYPAAGYRVTAAPIYAEVDGTGSCRCCFSSIGTACRGAIALWLRNPAEGTVDRSRRPCECRVARQGSRGRDETSPHAHCVRVAAGLRDGSDREPRDPLHRRPDGRRVRLRHSETYTITGGTLKVTLHEDENAAGGFNFTSTIVPQRVTAVNSSGDEFRAVGAVWFGATGNPAGSVQSTFLQDPAGQRRRRQG